MWRAERLEAEEEGALTRQALEVALAERLDPLAERLLRAGREEDHPHVLRRSTRSAAGPAPAARRPPCRCRSCPVPRRASDVGHRKRRPGADRTAELRQQTRLPMAPPSADSSGPAEHRRHQRRAGVGVSRRRPGSARRSSAVSPGGRRGPNGRASWCARRRRSAWHPPRRARRPRCRSRAAAPACAAGDGPAGSRRRSPPPPTAPERDARSRSPAPQRRQAGPLRPIAAPSRAATNRCRGRARLDPRRRPAARRSRHEPVGGVRSPPRRTAGSIASSSSRGSSARPCLGSPAGLRSPPFQAHCADIAAQHATSAPYHLPMLGAGSSPSSTSAGSASGSTGGGSSSSSWSSAGSRASTATCSATRRGDLEPYALAVVSALGFFGSILLHELGHAFVALRNGIGISEITLWMFGGIARLKRDPDSPGVRVPDRRRRPARDRC